MNNRTRASWRDDLAASRDLSRREIESFGFFLSWFENWRVSGRHGANLQAARHFWREVVRRDC